MSENQDAPSAEGLQASSVAPSFTVNDLPRSIQFYTEGLGFEVIERNEHEGVVRFVMLQAGTAQLGLGQDDFALGRERVKGVGLRNWIRTHQDVVALADRAKAAGIELDDEPQPLPWGPMAFAFTDPDGFKFTVIQGG